MSRRENFLRVLRHGEAQKEIPLWELHFHIWDQVGGEHFVSGKEYLSLTETERSRALQKDAEILVKCGEELGFSAVSIPDNPWNCFYTLPDLDRVQLVRNIRRLAPDFAVVCSCAGVIAMPSGEEFEEFCFQMFDEPKVIDEMCKKIYDSFLENSKRLIDAGADAIYTGSDVADNRAPFFNREQQQRWYFPYLRKFSDYLHSQGVPAILHTDGNIDLLLEDIRNSGVDGLQAIDPLAGMDIRRVQEFMENRVTLCGNLDCGIMLTATPDQVYEEAKRILLECREYPGFIFGNSNAVAIETPIENYRAMLEAWHKYGSI